MGQRGTPALEVDLLLTPKLPLGCLDAERGGWLAICKARETNRPRVDVLERLLDDGVHALAGGCMEDAGLAEPEGDVVRPAVIAEADEVAGAGLRFVDLDRRNLLLVRVARNEPAGSPSRGAGNCGSPDPSASSRTQPG